MSVIGILVVLAGAYGLAARQAYLRWRAVGAGLAWLTASLLLGALIVSPVPLRAPLGLAWPLRQPFLEFGAGTGLGLLGFGLATLVAVRGARRGGSRVTTVIGSAFLFAFGIVTVSAALVLLGVIPVSR